MASTATRGEIVTQALSLAGRSTELRQSANQWLNFFLKHVAITFRFPELRKVGDAITLYQGTTTAALPQDFGAGMEKQGLLLGTERTPLDEYSYDDFVGSGGFLPDTGASGRPRIYMIDESLGVFRFNSAADQNYSFTPIYYALPPLPATDLSADNQKIWLDNDLIAVQGLIWFIYQFTNDEREMAQEAKVNRMILEWKREVVKTGGTSNVLLSPRRFKRARFR